MTTKIVFFDCDGTLTRVKSSWQYLHERFDLWNELADEYQRLFRSGLIDYEEFCRKDATLWKGRKVDEVEAVIQEIEYHDGVRETAHALRETGITTVILSTGLSILVDRVRRDLGFSAALSNELIARDGVLTGEVKINVGHGRKGQWVRRILQDGGFAKDAAAAVGDGEGDKEMFEEVALAIGYNSDARILPFVDHDLRDGAFSTIATIIANSR